MPNKDKLFNVETGEEITAPLMVYQDIVPGGENEYTQWPVRDTTNSPWKRICKKDVCPMLHLAMNACPLEFCPCDYPLSMRNSVIVEKQD